MASSIVPPQQRLTEPSGATASGRGLWRAGSWGLAAAVSLAAVAVVTQTDVGKTRLQDAVAQAPALRHVFLAGNASQRPAATTPARPVAAMPVHTADNKAEMQRLETAMRTLTADRDRLAGRLASLEQNLDDMTGSIKAVTDATAAARAATDEVKVKIAQRPPAAPPPVAPPTMNFPPIISMVGAAPPSATPAALTSIAGKPAESKPSRPLEANAQAPSEPGAPVKHDAAPAHAAPSAPPAAPPKLVAVPMPPTHVASATRETAQPAAPARHEFGIDVAGARSIGALHAQWAAVKSNFGPLLVGMHPLAAPHHKGHSRYRLVVGPVPSLAAAARICARLTAAGSLCEPANFVGTRLVQR
jgi:SPOR domain